jgi:hypothetical protein
MPTMVQVEACGATSIASTLSNFHQDRPPPNKRQGYPADPPTVERIIAVMRSAGEDEAVRLRGLIVVHCRAGLRRRRRRAIAPSTPAITGSVLWGVDPQRRRRHVTLSRLSGAAGILRVMADTRIVTWTSWIDGTIKNEFLTMHLHRHAWQEATKLVEDNAELPDSYWWEFMYETYAITQAAAIRRQVDVRRDTASLLRLLNAVQRGTSEITRAYWIDTLWKAEDRIDREMARRQWDEHYGGHVGDHLDPAIPKADAAAIVKAGEDVKQYVDTNIAHTSADPVVRQVTIKVADVHQAMDTLAEIFRRYYGLFTASTLATLTPILQHDFFAVFRQPWMRKEYAPPSGPFYDA